MTNSVLNAFTTVVFHTHSIVSIIALDQQQAISYTLYTLLADTMHLLVKFCHSVCHGKMNYGVPDRGHKVWYVFKPTRNANRCTEHTPRCKTTQTTEWREFGTSIECHVIDYLSRADYEKTVMLWWLVIKVYKVQKGFASLSCNKLILCIVHVDCKLHSDVKDVKQSWPVARGVLGVLRTPTSKRSRNVITASPPLC